MIFFCSLLEQARPLQRSIKHEELWYYKNPFSPDTVSTPVVLVGNIKYKKLPLPVLLWFIVFSKCVSVGLPSAFIIVHYLTTADRSDLLQAFLGEPALVSLVALCSARRKGVWYLPCSCLFQNGVWPVRL